MADAEALALESLLADLEPADADLRRFLGELAGAHDIEPLHRGLVDPDDVAELPAEGAVRPGDLYVLGDHRLLCGDATDMEHVRRAFGDASEADLMWTDPPYGVAFQTKLSTEEAVARHRRTDGLEITNDEPADIPALLRAAFTNAPLKPGGSFYVSSPSSGDVLPAFYSALVESGMPVRQQLIWVKDVFVMGRHDYH
jgi:DNA modification methylase